MVSSLDDVVFSLDAARRDVLAAAELIDAVARDAQRLGEAMAWVSPAMAAFRQRQSEWESSLVSQRRHLRELDDALEHARSRLLASGGSGVFGWSPV